jgi:hypothetical protein
MSMFDCFKYLFTCCISDDPDRQPLRSQENVRLENTNTIKPESLLVKSSLIPFNEPYSIQTEKIIITENSKLIYNPISDTIKWFDLYVSSKPSSQDLLDQMTNMEKIFAQHSDVPARYDQTTYIKTKDDKQFCRLHIPLKTINFTINNEHRNRDSTPDLLARYLVPGKTIKLTIVYTHIWIHHESRNCGIMPKISKINVILKKNKSNLQPILPPQPILIDSTHVNCVVCLESVSELTALIPCGHTQTCGECIAKLSSKICPICKSKFKSQMKVYLQ